MQDKKDFNLNTILFHIVSGILIGGGAILPGVSGGVMCVIFGVYRPLMELLSRPFTAIKKYWKMFAFVFLGVAIGFVGIAKLVGGLFEKYEFQMLCLFIGLILGTVPMLYKNAQEQSKSKKNDMIALVGAFVVLLTVLLLLKSGDTMHFELNTLLAFISGVIWGFSLVVPGLSSSSLLIYMGLYENIMLEVGKLNMGVIVPLMVGIFLVAVLFARIIDNLFEKHNNIASHAVIGLVLASTISIVPSFADTKAITIGVLLAALGFVGALQLDKWQATIKKE
ncbi:MAG: DUF368 domain-containing protein [Christensenellaceae bacterium]|mgnify:FL=1|nr:DUF368 domain-containing protein [Christensenellaceae bacterium]